MTNLQQNRLSMYLAVLGVMAKYNSVWSAMSAIADMVTRLQDFVASIQETSGVQGSPLTGIAGGKRRLRMDMMQETVALAGDVHALAVKNSDSDMQAKSDLELTDLVRMGETVVAPRCQEIQTYANTNSAALIAGYGVEATDISDQATSITTFTGTLGQTRQAIGVRKEATGDIAEDEETADALLNSELDKTMKKFETKNPPFFGEYTSARMIIDLGVHHEKTDNQAASAKAPASDAAKK